MSLECVKQLHSDLMLVPDNLKAHSIEESDALIFNTNLAEANAEHPGDAIISKLPKANARSTRYHNLLALTGQLKSRLAELSPKASADFH
jgi:hypothetical protein